METGEPGRSLASGSGRPLADVNEDGLFRDGLRRAVDERDGRASASRADRRRCSRATGAAAGLRRLLVFGALWLLGFLDATYLAGPLHFGRHGGAVALLARSWSAWAR